MKNCNYIFYKSIEHNNLKINLVMSKNRERSKQNAISSLERKMKLLEEKGEKDSKQYETLKIVYDNLKK